MRLTLDIMEATAVLSAIDLAEEAGYLRIKSARKLNNLEEVTSTGCQMADLMSARRKVKDALASATQSNLSSQ